MVHEDSEIFDAWTYVKSVIAGGLDLCYSTTVKILRMIEDIYSKPYVDSMHHLWRWHYHHLWR